MFYYDDVTRRMFFLLFFRYGDTEEYIRRATWEKNVRFVQKHNLEADLGMHTFRVGMNEHGDLVTKTHKNVQF